ncbi:AAA family ATPase [Actinoplanes sp. NPDC000266]
MESVSASGEQEAIRGYGYQYDHVAAIAYDLYREKGEFELRLVDPEAGAVDDCVLVRPGPAPEVHGYQYKSASGNLTLAALLTERKTRGGKPKASLFAELVEGWRKLRTRYGGHKVIVHLVSPEPLSRWDRPFAAALKSIGPTGTTGPSPQHSAAFAAAILQPLREGKTLPETDQLWKPVLAWVQQQASLQPDEVEPFLASLDIDTETAAAMPARPDRLPPDQRLDDVGRLAAVLYRRVQDSEPGEAVVLHPDDVAALAGFGSRGRRRHLHRFPVEFDRYTPLVAAEEALTVALDTTRSGYLCVLGPPGSGKSTLIAHATPALADRVITYLAFLPGDAAAAGRASATDFLHDVVVQLEESALRVKDSLPERDVHELRLRFQKQLAAASKEFIKTGRRTFVIVDGLDHVVRAEVSEPLLSELPSPAAVPDGVIILLGSQNLTLVNPRIVHHVSEPLADGSSRTIDLTAHRLATVAVQRACRQIAAETPGLVLTNRQIDRVAQLVNGHPLALGYVTNALVDLAGPLEHPGDGPIPTADVDEALIRCVRYSGSVADDYAAYLADLPERDAVRQLLGDMARLRSPIDIGWVKSWANETALQGLRGIRHLFRILDRKSWMFFHDSFRQFVLESTRVNVLGDPDPDADITRHAVLADRCASADENTRERGEEFFHASQAGQPQRALALATPHHLRARFLAGTSPVVLTEDIHIALRLAAQEDDAASLVGLMLIHAELRSREQALQEVDLTGMWISAGDPAAAIAHALPDGTPRISSRFALQAAIRLDEIAHPAARLLFDAADIREIDAVGSSEYWDTLQAWAAGTARFRPLSVIHTILRRMSERAAGRRSTRRDLDAYALGGRAAHFAGYAIAELLRIGRTGDAEELAAALRSALLGTLAASPHENSRDSNRSPGESAYQTIAEASLQIAAEQLKAGHLSQAFDTLRSLALPAGDDNAGQSILAVTDRASRGDAARLALQIAVASTNPDSEETPTTADSEQAESDSTARTLAASAFAFGNDLLAGIGNPAAIVIRDLSAVEDVYDVLSAAVIERVNPIVAAGHQARLTGLALTADLLITAAPQLLRPLTDQPTDARIDPNHVSRNQRVPAHDEQLNKTITDLAVFNAATILDALPTLTMRGLALRVLAAMPKVAEGLSLRDRTSRINSALLRILVDVAARHSQELLRFVATGMNEWDDGSLLWGEISGGSRDDDYGAHQRQILGLYILQHGVQPDWLAGAVAEVDREIEYAAGAYERTDLLVTQAAAHLHMGDTQMGRTLLDRVMPESFSPYWRKDPQLDVWIQWLIRATQGNPGALLSEAEELAPLIAALAEATEGSAEAAAERLLCSVAEAAPRHAVRLAAWQLAQGSLSFAAAHNALVAGMGRKLLEAHDGDPRDPNAEQTAQLLCAVVAALLGPMCPTVPTEALTSLRSLIEQMPSPAAAIMTEQLSRAVDVHVPGGARRHWRDVLELPATPTSRRDESDDEASLKSQQSVRSSRDWGTSDYGHFKHIDGSTRTPEAMRDEISDLDSALTWRSLQADPGTFSWTPILRRLIRKADDQQLEKLVQAFSGVHDEATLLVAVAHQRLANGNPDAAAATARAALGRAEPVSWDRHHSAGIRRKAWSILAACEGQQTRSEAMQDLVELLVAADYWPGELMLQLDDILPVIAPSLPAKTVWVQVRQHLLAMSTGIPTHGPAPLEGPIHGGWWAQQRPMLEADRQPYSKPSRPDTNASQTPPAELIQQALLELTFTDLDHPAWTVREGASAVLSWALTQTGSLAKDSGTRAASLLLSRTPRLELAAPLAPAALTVGTVLSPSTGGAEADQPEDAALAGDLIRETAARAVAAAGRKDLASSSVLGAGSGSWLVDGCLRQAAVIDDRIRAPLTPLPAIYHLAVPRTRRRLPDAVDQFGPYARRIHELAEQADMDPAILLRRLNTLASRAMQHLPDDHAIQQAATGMSLHGMLVPPPWAQAVRAAFGRMVAELIAAQLIQPNDRQHAAHLRLTDIGLVTQPYVATPPWVPTPRVDDWLSEELWLGDTEPQLERYAARLVADETNGENANLNSRLTLTSNLLDVAATVDIESSITLIGADHEFVTGQRSDRGERYMLSATFDQSNRPTPSPRSNLVLLPEPAPAIAMQKVKDWRLEDGTFNPAVHAQPTRLSDLAELPLVVWTTSAALHNNATTWVCLSPVVAIAHGWKPHPKQPLCWQDSSGNITAATVLWRRSTLNTKNGSDKTVGEGSAVILTNDGKNSLERTAPLKRVHQLTRYAIEDGYQRPESQRVVTSLLRAE